MLASSFDLIRVGVGNYDEAKGTWRENLEYKFDLLMSKPGASLLFLIILTGLFTICGGFLYYILASAEDLGLLEAIFKSWTYVADPGTHAGEDALGARFASWIITLGGFVSFAILIGIVGDTIQSKVDDLKKGKSVVLEEGHTLILGWSNKIFCFLDNLAIAQESEGGGTVVILADDGISPEEKMELIEANCTDLKGTNVIVRSGNIMAPGDLNKMGATKAKCAVVFADEKNKRGSDARALRVVLALVRSLRIESHIVVEVVDKECSHLLEMAGEGHVVPLIAHEMIGRLLLQCARQPGLAEVYMNLLSFDDSEFYVSAHPELEGKTFGEICYWFDGAIVIGFSRAGPDGQDIVFINPQDDVEMQPGDSIIVIAEDDSTYNLREDKPIDNAQFTTPIQGHRFRTHKKAQKPTNALFCGWRPNMEEMISHYDEFVNPGSKLTILCLEDDTLTKKLESMKFQNTTVAHITGDPQSRSDLVAAFKLQGDEPFESVVVFSDVLASGSYEELSVADSLVLITTLHLQDIAKKMTLSSPLQIISEIYDPNTKTLVADKGNDWVVSNELVSMALTQMAEAKENRQIWEELIGSAEGNEIYLLAVSQYLLEKGEEVCFWDLFARGRTRGEIFLGWIFPNGKPILNPEDKFKKQVFPSGTRIAVLALDIIE